MNRETTPCHLSQSRPTVRLLLPRNLRLRTNCIGARIAANRSSDLRPRTCRFVAAAASRSIWECGSTSRTACPTKAKGLPTTILTRTFDNRPIILLRCCTTESVIGRENQPSQRVRLRLGRPILRWVGSSIMADAVSN